MGSLRESGHVGLGEPGVGLFMAAEVNWGRVRRLVVARHAVEYSLSGGSAVRWTLHLDRNRAALDRYMAELRARVEEQLRMARAIGAVSQCLEVSGVCSVFISN